MKNIIYWGTTLLVLVVVNLLIVKKEDTLASGQTMLMRLAPFDPGSTRSLMQGDYMILRYTIAREVKKSAITGQGLYCRLS